jgi:hypothetical protein
MGWKVIDLLNQGSAEIDRIGSTFIDTIQSDQVFQTP